MEIEGVKMKTTNQGLRWELETKQKWVRNEGGEDDVNDNFGDDLFF